MRKNCAIIAGCQSNSPEDDVVLLFICGDTVANMLRAFC